MLNFQETSYVDIKGSSETYTGTYTNSDSQDFEVTVYGTGIDYYENNYQQYGTKATPGMAIFSFVPEEAATYTISVKPTTNSNNAPTIGLYTDAGLTTALASKEFTQNSTGVESIVYENKSPMSDPVYFGIYKGSSGTNFYIGYVEISYSKSMTNFKGSVEGIADDDAEIRFVSGGKTIETKKSTYSTEGVKLEAGTTYNVEAVADSGVYYVNDVVASADKADSLDLTFNKINFDFPLDFKTAFAEKENSLYAKYMDLYPRGKENTSTGITLPTEGIKYTQYGYKTGANDIITFKAKESGICTVALDIYVSDSDYVILKVNGKAVPNHTAVESDSSYKLSAMVNAGDSVTVYSNTKKNLYFNKIDVSYTETAPLKVAAVGKLAYVVIPEDMANTVTEVGVIFADKDNAASLDPEGDGVAKSSTVYEKISYDSNEYKADSGYVFGAVLDASGSAYAYGYCKTANGDYCYTDEPAAIN